MTQDKKDPGEEHELVGLSSWLPDSSKPSSQAFYGLDRTAPLPTWRTYRDPRWLRLRKWFARVVLRVPVE